MRAALFILLFAGCGDLPALDYGDSLFHNKAISSAPNNVFTCATCHQIAATTTETRPGYNLWDSASRPSYWGGTVETLLDATNQCLTQFTRSSALAENDSKGRALYVYLKASSPDATADALPLTVVQTIKDLPSGDATQGETEFKNTCGVCHGEPHTGKGRISTDASLVPDDSLSNHGTDPVTGARPVVIEKVRHGKFFNIGGIMPLYSLEAMSDAQLGDILAYLEGFGLPKSP